MNFQFVDDEFTNLYVDISSTIGICQANDSTLTPKHGTLNARVQASA